MSDDEDPFASLLGKRYHDESLRPPPESGNGEAEEDSWDRREALVDNDAYMIDRRNHTTARCPVTRRGRGGGKKDTMQVTFCLAPPPHVSYFCMSYGSGDPIRFCSEPRIFGAEGDLAVIGLVHYWTLQYAPRCVYFVYRAPFIGHGLAELRPLPHPPSEVFPEQHESDCHLGHNEVGILCYRSRSGSEQLALPLTSGDDYDAYKIATLCRYGTNQYVLYTYDSMADAWTRTPAAFPRAAPLRTAAGANAAGQRPPSLWHVLHVVLLPGHRCCQWPDKFVDLQVHASPGSRTPNGWTAVTWSMAPGDSGFTKDGELNSRDMVNPMEPSVFVAHPTLSSCDDDVLYLTTMTSLDDSMSQVIAVNMKEKTVERTAKYTTQRDASMAFAYTRTTISKFLARGQQKATRSVLHESFRKKLPAINPSEDLPTMGDEGDPIELE
ncbi:hypothetical protein VPH35_034865 [Triticum aestivum]